MNSHTNHSSFHKIEIGPQNQIGHSNRDLQPVPKEGAFSALMHCKMNHATSLRDPDFCPRNNKIGPGFQVDNRILFRIEQHFSTTDLENVDKII